MKNTTVEPLFVFKDHVQMDQLHQVAQEKKALNLPRSALLLDSSEAKENLVVITRELSIIRAVFRGDGSVKLYNIPPRSFLSTKHLRKYLSFVRKHVTGIRVQL